MKKIAWLLVIGMIICSTGCAQQKQATTANKPLEHSQSHWIKSNDLKAQTVTHKGLTNVLPDLKELAVEALGKIDYLNWEQFESVTEIRDFKDPDLAKEFTDATAFYAAGSHIIVVCPDFFSIESGDQQTYILIHELMHSLVGTGKNGSEETMNCFMEGIADYLANQVLFNTNLKYNLVYQNELYCISWLMALCGNDGITEIICSGDILSFVDKQTGDTDAGEKLHGALIVIDKSKDHEAVKNAILTEIYILRKMSGSNTEVREKFTKIFKTAYAPYLN